MPNVLVPPLDGVMRRAWAQPVAVAGVGFDARLVPVQVGADVDVTGDGRVDECQIAPEWPDALRQAIDRPGVADFQIVNLSFGSYDRSQLAADGFSGRPCDRRRG